MLILNQKNIDVNSLDYAGHSALDIAIRRGHIDIVKLLLKQQGIDIYTINKDNETSFLRAIKSNRKDIALTLYNFAPDIVDIQRKQDGETALIHIAHNHRGNINLFNFLINECKANMWLTDKHGKTFVHCLFLFDPTFDLNQFTFFYNYNAEQKKLFLHSQLELATLIKFPDVSNENYKDYWLHIHYPHLCEFINYCKRYGVNLNQRNIKGKIPLDMAYEQYKYNNQEGLYHAFLRTTEKISDYELWYHLSKNGIIKDIYQHIMKYYCALTIDTHCVTSIMYDSHYYGKKEAEKIAFKKLLLHQEYQRLGIRNADPNTFILALN